MEKIYKKEISEVGKKPEEILQEFFENIGATKTSDVSFIYNNEKWFIDFHPFDHSDDIIVDESVAQEYDNFLLVKKGSERVRIPGWIDRKTLIALEPKDIYRNGTRNYVVMDTNVIDLSNFKIADEDLILKEEFVINQQEAENLGHTEMISGILSGIHKFCKDAKIRFNDINQQDEFMIGDKVAKIYTRDYLSDEDMLISEDYYQKNKDRIDIYILCKIKGGNYNYLGYVKKEVVDGTRIVKMVGSDSDSAVSDDKRRIFAEQYLKLTDFLKIYEKTEDKEKIEMQNYIPLHVHGEFSVGDGYGTSNYMTEILKRKGFKACALTDHGTLAGVWEFQKACLVKGIKPIIGCEFYMSLKDKKEERFHLTVLVKNEIGWKNILKLQNTAARENFYYRPILNIDDLMKNSEGLVVLSGCSSGLFYKLIKENSDKLDYYFDLFKNTFGDDFYVEIQPHTIESNQEIMEKLYGYSISKKIKPVFTNDVHYPLKEDKKIHDAVKAINFKKKYGEAGYSDDCFYFMQNTDIQKRLKEKSPWMLNVINELLKNTNEVADKCDFKIEPGEEADTLPRLDFDFIKKNSADLYSEFLEWKKDESNFILTNHIGVENE